MTRKQTPLRDDGELALHQLASDVTVRKLIHRAINIAIGALISGGTIHLIDVRWLGRSILGSYFWQHHISTTAPIPDNLCETFGSESLRSFFSAAPMPLAISLIFLLLLLAHITIKKNITQTSVPTWPLVNVYFRHYYLITIILMSVVLVAFLISPWACGNLIAILITPPTAIYLALYFKDGTSELFSERFTYYCMAVTLVTVVLAWPSLYGKRDFDPALPVVIFTPPSNLDHCGPNLRKGPIFRSYIASQGSTAGFFRTCFNDTETKFIDFFESSQSYIVVGEAKISSQFYEVAIPLR